MKDLIDYQRFQIESLQARVCELENIINTLSGYCFEALSEDITAEYKTVIKKEIYNLKTN
jgi:hypothetical protein